MTVLPSGQVSQLTHFNFMVYPLLQSDDVFFQYNFQTFILTLLPELGNSVAVKIIFICFLPHVGTLVTPRHIYPQKFFYGFVASRISRATNLLLVTSTIL